MPPGDGRAGAQQVADRAGLLLDPELAARRMTTYLSLHGIGR